MNLPLAHNMKPNIKLLSLFFGLAIFSLISSCDWLTKKACGEASGRDKEFFDSLNVAFKDSLVIDAMPCYPGFTEAHLKMDIDSVRIEAIWKIVQEEGFVDLFVYDKDGNLIRGNPGGL